MSRFLWELRKWVDGNSLLVVTFAGILTRLYCPFSVEAIESVNGIKKGGIYRVDKIGVSANKHLVYYIQGKSYLFRHFKITTRN